MSTTESRLLVAARCLITALVDPRSFCLSTWEVCYLHTCCCCKCRTDELHNYVDQEGLCTRFFRASNAMDKVIPGTGLGLRIVKQIVNERAGEIRLASAEGEGTPVVVDLPLSVQNLS